MAAMKHAPHQLLECLHQLGEVANVPYVGHPDNNIFPSSQVNIATPVPEEIGEHFFGGEFTWQAQNLVLRG